MKHTHKCATKKLHPTKYLRKDEIIVLVVNTRVRAISEQLEQDQALWLTGGNCSKILLQGNKKLFLLLLLPFGWRRIHKGIILTERHINFFYCLCLKNNLNNFYWSNFTFPYTYKYLFSSTVKSLLISVALLSLASNTNSFCLAFYQKKKKTFGKFDKLVHYYLVCLQYSLGIKTVSVVFRYSAFIPLLYFKFSVP